MALGSRPLRSHTASSICTRVLQGFRLARGGAVAKRNGWRLYCRHTRGASNPAAHTLNTKSKKRKRKKGKRKTERYRRRDHIRLEFVSSSDFCAVSRVTVA
eukprot:3202659-Rhodomonas_salina.1